MTRKKSFISKDVLRICSRCSTVGMVSRRFILCSFDSKFRFLDDYLCLPGRDLEVQTGKFCYTDSVGMFPVARRDQGGIKETGETETLLYYSQLIMRIEFTEIRSLHFLKVINHFIFIFCD